MDCLIPSHNIRAITCAVGCLCRISKDLYIEYSPFSGLILRTLNDAKSAFCSFEFEPPFFERCAASHGAFVAGGRGRKRSKKQKKNYSNKRVKKKTQEKEQDEENDGEYDEKFTCRVPARLIHSILKPRKGVISLRIRSCTSHQGKLIDRNFIVPDYENYTSDKRKDQQEQIEDGSMLQLSFEFKCNEIGPMKITRRIGVEECDSIFAVADKLCSSELIFAPKTLGRMLDPLYRTAEVALTVNDSLKTVSATSFHTGAENTLLASSKTLNTETCSSCSEFIQYSFMNDRDITEALPADVNEEVTIVFSIKEVKAILQFASQVNTDFHLDVSMNFEWGGKPILFETEAEGFSGQLILATLGHELIAPKKKSKTK